MYLWQEDSNIEQIFQKIIPETPQNWSQTPLYEVKEGSEYDRDLPYLIQNPNSPGEAVAIEINGNNAQLWLGGINLRKVQPGTRFTAIDGTGQVRVLARNGIIARSNIEKSLTNATLLSFMG